MLRVGFFVFLFFFCFFGMNCSTVIRKKKCFLSCSMMLGDKLAYGSCGKDPDVCVCTGARSTGGFHAAGSGTIPQ